MARLMVHAFNTGFHAEDSKSFDTCVSVNGAKTGAAKYVSYRDETVSGRISIRIQSTALAGQEFEVVC